MSVICCGACGDEFEQTRTSQQFCKQKECKRKRAAERQAKYMAKPENKKRRAKYMAKYWAKPENKKRRAEYAAKPENKKHMAKYAAKRAAKRRASKYNNGKMEDVCIDELFRRHNSICGICKKKVDPSLKSPHPWSRSIDHVIPLSKGGQHTYANMQLAHLGCNSRKSNHVVSGGE